MCQRAVLLGMPGTQTIDIEFSNLYYDVTIGFRGSKKEILKGVGGSFKSGELTAIMGPSGAGKSSLLNILTGFHQNDIKGQIDYIGIEGKQNRSEYREETCYIQQDDQLYPLFTVDEIMRMASDLKLGNSLSEKSKQLLIDDVLDTLDLSLTKDTRCDRLSGGQKKRLSIALELLDNPPVMFLDEPTTGLDSSSSLQCVTMLRNLARGGRTIICTIHQPSAVIFEMFDYVYLLADGKCIYQGGPTNTIEYFAKIGLQCPKYHNPADYMIEVVSKEYGNFNDQLAMMASKDDQSWRDLKSDKTRELELDSQKQILLNGENKATVLVNRPTELYRFLILMNRCFLQLYRDWTVTHLKLILHFLVGIFFGLLFLDAGSDGSKTISNIGFLMATVVYLCYTSMMPAVLKFPSELAVLKKEKFNNWYKLKTYYAAFLVTNLPIQCIFTIVYSAVAYFLSSQPLDWNRFCMFSLMAILTTVIAESLGLVLGTTVDPVNGTFLGAISTCAMLVFAGFFVLFRHMPKPLFYVSYFSYLKYSLNGLVLAIYGYDRDKLPCPKEKNYCHYRAPMVILEELDMMEDTFWTDVVVLGVNFLLLRILAYCTLKRKLASA